jgi:hypothetical protein
MTMTPLPDVPQEIRELSNTLDVRIDQQFHLVGQLVPDHEHLYVLAIGVLVSAFGRAAAIRATLTRDISSEEAIDSVMRDLNAVVKVVKCAIP